jgi:fibronectin-binding autotransporter adhesin
MKPQKNPFLRRSSIATAATIAFTTAAHAADVTLAAGSYTDTQVYNNGTVSGVVTLNSGANYSFDSLNLPLAWNRVVLNSGASLSVEGNLSVDFSGVSLNGGTLSAGGLLLHDSPNWAGSIPDGKQTIEQGESVINGATIVANQTNPNFISFIGSVSTPVWDVNLANNLWLGNDGGTIDSNGNNIGITMALGNFPGQVGALTKTGPGTLTLSTNNSYSGGTTVNGGVLEIAGSSAGNSYIRGTVTVNNGAELRYTGGDGTGFGFNGGNKLDTININGGLVSSDNQMTHLWATTVNMTGGELRVNSGVSSPTGYRIEWNQSTVSTLAAASAATISGRINLRADGGYNSATFNVEDGAATTDLLVSATITQSSAVGITKNGAGTMELAGTNTYTGTTTVTEGTLKLSNPFIFDGSAVVIGSGAKINLNYLGSDIVGSLVIDGTSVPSGSYNESHPTYGTYFEGTGTLQVGAPGPQLGGTWVAATNGNWSDSGNWQSGNVANGSNNTATFNPAGPVTATVDGNRFIGALTFAGFDSTIDGTAVLTLDTTSLSKPQVGVASGLTATLATNIGGTLGLEKTGPGTLVLTGTKSFTGGTTVTEGTLELQGATGGNAQIHGALTVNSGATVTLTGGDGTGFGYFNDPVTTINVNGGTINAISSSHLGFGQLMTVTLDNGAALQGTWQWNGSSLLGFSSIGNSTNTIDGSLNLRNDAGSDHPFNVDDGTSATDLLIGGTLSGANANVIKNGAGTVALTATNLYTGNTVVNEGTFEVSSSGALRFRPTTNGVTNSVSGTASATLSFLGTVDLDLGAANTTIGDSWNLFNLGSFSGPAPILTPAVVTSSVGAFAEVTSGTWELPVNGAKWVFTESTGNLAYVAAATDYDTWFADNGVTGGEDDDDDSDGLTNFEEYTFGTDPTGGSEVNPIAVPLDKATGTFSYTRRAQALTGLTYTVWTSTDLGTWTADSGAIQGAPSVNGEVETVPVTLSSALLSNPKLFIQVRAQ